MSSDAASSEPRKRSWKRWIVVLACVVALITIVLLAIPPKKEPVRVWFVRSEYTLARKQLVFQVTNGLQGEIQFSAVVVTGAIHKAEAPPQPVPITKWVSARRPARTNFTFALDAPPINTAYYLEWRFRDIRAATTPWGRLRNGCYEFLIAHKMPRLATRFAPMGKAHYILSTELKE